MSSSLIMLDGVRPRPINLTRDVESLSREAAVILESGLAGFETATER